MRCWAVLILVLLSPQDDLRRRVDDGVGRFASDDVRARDAAAAELTGLGLKAVAELRRHVNHPDREIRLRVQQVIAEIERRDRILAVRPAPGRLSLELRDVPLAEAIQRVFTPFGLRTKLSPKGGLPKAQITLTLKDATLWQALDAVTAEGQMEIDDDPGPLSVNAIYARPWTFAPARNRHRRFRWADAGEARVFGSAHGYVGNNDVGFEADVALPPGHVARRVQIEDARLKDDTGRDLGAPMEEKSSFASAPRHVTGNVVWWDLWRRGQPLTAKDLGEAKTFDLEGTLVVVYPKDLERAEVDFPDPSKPVHLKLPGISLTSSLKDPDKERYMAELEWSIDNEKEGDAFWIWMTDAGGRMLSDTPRIQFGPTGSMGGHVHVHGKIARAVLVRVWGEDVVKTPFVIKGIPRPRE